MEHQHEGRAAKPYNIQQRLLVFACDVVAAVEFLHTRGPVPRALSYQLLNSGTSIGANAEEADGASSPRDFTAKMRIALKEAKETRYRLRICRHRGFLDSTYDPLVQESDELVRILGSIVHRSSTRAAR
jgi:four helix bundle protein